jgi:tRNA dimethylallyltransferase
MMEAGLLQEVKELYPHRHLAVLRTLGYQEIFAHLDGDYDLNRAVELIKQASRRYAKRQITWMRRDGYWKHIDPDQPAEALSYLSFVQNQNLNLRTVRVRDQNRVEFQRGERIMAAQSYTLGKKGRLVDRLSWDFTPPSSLDWLQQEAERRIKQ